MLPAPVPVRDGPPPQAQRPLLPPVPHVPTHQAPLGTTSGSQIPAKLQPLVDFLTQRERDTGNPWVSRTDVGLQFDGMGLYESIRYWANAASHWGLVILDAGGRSEPRMRLAVSWQTLYPIKASSDQFFQATSRRPGEEQGAGQFYRARATPSASIVRPRQDECRSSLFLCARQPVRRGRQTPRAGHHRRRRRSRTDRRDAPEASHQAPRALHRHHPHLVDAVHRRAVAQPRPRAPRPPRRRGRLRASDAGPAPATPIRPRVAVLSAQPQCPRSITAEAFQVTFTRPTSRRQPNSISSLGLASFSACRSSPVAGSSKSRWLSSTFGLVLNHFATRTRADRSR